VGTAQDPYNVRAGFMYAHFGWMMVKQDPREVGYANIDDLNADPMIMWQHKYYGPVRTARMCVCV
jgi:stearoyl-CoA desaturase (Delta-9 desaturase)